MLSLRDDPLSRTISTKHHTIFPLNYILKRTNLITSTNSTNNTQYGNSFDVPWILFHYEQENCKLCLWNNQPVWVNRTTYVYKVILMRKMFLKFHKFQLTDAKRSSASIHCVSECAFIESAWCPVGRNCFLHSSMCRVSLPIPLIDLSTLHRAISIH